MQNCYNTGERIPREKKFEVDERLANKHIQTLQFVQEVVNENKVLKKKVEELEVNHSIFEKSLFELKELYSKYWYFICLSKQVNEVDLKSY